MRSDRTGRRGFLAAGLASAVRAAGLPGRDTRPNILFLLTDDQRWNTLGAAGNPIIKTPNLDRLAADGVLFRNNFCTTSICMASRASILTGLYMRAHGINDFHTPLKPADLDRSYPMLMRRAGYRTGFIGKWGVGDDLPRDRFDYFKGFPGQGKYFEKGATAHLTNIQGEQAEEFLEGCRAGEPWCLSVSFKAPHAQDEDPKQYLYDPALASLYRDARIPVPKTAAPEYFERMPEIFRGCEGRTRWKWRFDTPEHFQEMVKAYYRLITGVDIVVGRMRQALADRDFDRNTVIVFTSDNGYFLGERGMADKWLMYEESIRTPLIVYDPRQQGGGRTRSEMTLNIDIAPTLLDFAGVPAPGCMHGRRLRPLTGAAKPAWRREWFYEHHFQLPPTSMTPRSEGIRTEDWKYIRYIDLRPVREELYDLRRDPLEEHNLAGDARHRDRLATLRARWDAWTGALGRWTPEAKWSDPA